MAPVPLAPAWSPGLGGTRRRSSAKRSSAPSCPRVLGVQPAHRGPGGRVVPDSCLSRDELSPGRIRPVLYGSGP